jgi:AcrR family transcriptional regulator
MSRWEPNARERLAKAALELYSERGYERTTVAEIAKRAGLTERTFFRHYADKREVLFAGQDDWTERFAAAVRDAPAGLAPLEVVSRAVEVGAELLPEERRGRARIRNRVISDNVELRERELVKLAGLATAMATALRARGVRDPAARLAAEAGLAAFGVAVDRWVAEGEKRTLRRLIRDSFRQLKTVAAG